MCVGDKLLSAWLDGQPLDAHFGSGAPFCLNVTLSGRHRAVAYSYRSLVNYRSVVVMGKAEQITEPQAKLAAMRDFVEYVIRGRWNQVHPPTEQELKGTMVLSVPLVEASAKVRTGFAINDDEEYVNSGWTGIIPFKWTAQTPLRDPRGNGELEVPENIARYVRPQ